MKHTPPDSSHTLLSPWPARSGAFFFGGEIARRKLPRESLFPPEMKQSARKGYCKSLNLQY